MRVRSLLALLALAVASCSGGDGGALPLGEPSQEEAATAFDTLVARWGDELAFYAVVASLDGGYSAGQIIEHADDLAADGSIPLVSPDGPELGMLSPLPTTEGAAPPRLAAAPRQLVAGDDSLSPQNQYIDFIDATLGEAYDAGRAHLDAEAAFQQSVVEMTLLLGSSGYSVEQIVEALITDSWDLTISEAGEYCHVITDGDDIVTPQRVPLKFVELLCPGVFTATTTTTSSSSTTAAVGSGGADGTLDGFYAGGAEFLIDIQSYEFLDTRVEATVSGESIELRVVYTIRWARHSDNGVPTCTATVRDTLQGTGTVVGTTFTVGLAGVSREIVSAVGSSCNEDGDLNAELMVEWAEDTASPVMLGGEIAGGVLSGTIYEGWFGITATRG